MHKELRKACKDVPIILVKGEEPYFQRRFVDAVKKHYRGREYSVDVLDVKSHSDGDILDVLDGQSLFARKKLVIVSNVHARKKSPQLQSYAQEPAEDVVAVFVGNGKCDTPLCKAISSIAVCYDAKPLNPYKGEVEKWLIKEAQECGYTLAPSLARVIISNTEDSLFAVHNALRKVLLHADGEVVEKSDLVAVLSRTSTNQIYELTNAFGERDTQKVLVLVDAFYHQYTDDPSVMITKSLLNHLERLIRAKSLIKYGLSQRDAARVMNMKPYHFETNFYPQTKKYKLGELVSMYDGLCEVDIRVKGGGMENRLILEDYLVRVLQERC